MERRCTTQRECRARSTVALRSKVAVGGDPTSIDAGLVFTETLPAQGGPETRNNSRSLSSRKGHSFCLDFFFLSLSFFAHSIVRSFSDVSPQMSPVTFVPDVCPFALPSFPLSFLELCHCMSQCRHVQTSVSSIPPPLSLPSAMLIIPSLKSHGLVVTGNSQTPWLFFPP